MGQDKKRESYDMQMKTILSAAALAALLSGAAWAQTDAPAETQAPAATEAPAEAAPAEGQAEAPASGETVSVKIGVLNDRSGVYADLSGEGSVVAARMAVEDFGAAEKGINVEIVSADHQNKPDIASNIARQWIDEEGVDVIADVPTSSAALAVHEIVREKGKIFLVSGAAASDITGEKCSPNTVHWTYDTWALAHGTGTAMVKQGRETWFFLTA